MKAALRTMTVPGEQIGLPSRSIRRAFAWVRRYEPALTSVAGPVDDLYGTEAQASFPVIAQRQQMGLDRSGNRRSS